MIQAQILRKDGMKINTIAERLGVKERTVYNYLHNRVFKDGESRGRPSGSKKLDKFGDFIESKLAEDFHFNAETFLEKLKSFGYQGKITILRDHIRRRRNEIRKVAVYRFETLPGHQAQVDWAHAGHVIENGRKKKRYLFVMKLGYSRRSYMEFTTSMKMPSFLACHIRAFLYFGGIPEEILYDNMKTAFLYSAEDDRWYTHPKLLALARHYGFTPRRCQIRRPQTKGKVEREIRYFRFSFLRSAGNICHTGNEKMNERLLGWLKGVDFKVLRDFGQTRMERFAQDSMKIRELPSVHFEYRQPVPLIVSREGKITYETNKYSVSAEHLNKTLTGLYDPNSPEMEIYDGHRHVKTIRLEPDGASATVVNPTDQASLIKAWENGRQWEKEQARQAIERKKLRADAENYVRHPDVYDRAFDIRREDVLV